jgi:hypothetical protein
MPSLGGVEFGGILRLILDGVCGAGWWPCRARLGDLGGEPEVSQDVLDHRRLLNQRHEAQPTATARTGQDVDHHISPPDAVSIRGDDLKALSAGRVMDRFFKRVEAVDFRPERVELETIPGMDATRVQFVVQGSGSFVITVDSARGGLLQKDGSLP